MHSFQSIIDDLQEMEDTQFEYCANDGLLTMMILWGVATQVDDSVEEIRKNLYWREHDLVVTALEQMREYLQHPIWSAKKLEAEPVIPITEQQRTRILKVAEKAVNKFDSYCKRRADELVMNATAVKINTNILTVCWRECQEAALLFTNLCAEEQLVDPNLGIMALAIQKQAYLQIFFYAMFTGSSEKGPTGALKRLLPILQKELFESFAQQDANRMPGAQVLSTGPMPRGQSLNNLVAEQRPGPSSVIYMPGPRLHPGVARRVPDDYRKLIVLPDENGDMWPAPIEMEQIGTANAEMTDIRHLKIPIDRQFVPEVPKTHHVPRPRLRQARRERIPA